MISNCRGVLALQPLPHALKVNPVRGVRRRRVSGLAIVVRPLGIIVDGSFLHDLRFELFSLQRPVEHAIADRRELNRHKRKVGNDLVAARQEEKATCVDMRRDRRIRNVHDRAIEPAQIPLGNHIVAVLVPLGGLDAARNVVLLEPVVGIEEPDTVISFRDSQQRPDGPGRVAEVGVFAVKLQVTHRLIIDPVLRKPIRNHEMIGRSGLGENASNAAFDEPFFFPDDRA